MYRTTHIPEHLCAWVTFTLKQLPSFTFTHTSPQSFPNVGRSKKHEVQVLAEQIDLFTEAVAAKDHVVVDLTNKVIHTYIHNKYIHAYI